MDCLVLSVLVKERMETKMKFYYGVDPAEKREKLMKSKAAKCMIDEIISSADKAMSEDSIAFKMSDYMLYHKTGNRTVFENKYFGRRRKCSDIMLAYWLTQDEKYLEPLIDYISYICDEFTWCLPAHSKYANGLSQEIIEWVDLFQAETARFFAETVMCVGDKLPDYIFERMSYEVHRRIFKPFERFENNEYDCKENAYFWWESCRMNWATVCGAGCTMAALCFGTEQEAEKYVNKFVGCLDRYLDGIGDDGCCREGMSYWNYGFSHFVILAMAVKVYTDGKIDYFKNHKVKELAMFPQRIRLSESKVASISDGGEAYSFHIGLMSLLKSIYSDVLLPDIKYGTRRGNIDSVCELLWFDENYKCDKTVCETNYLSDAQWYISRREKFSFVAKGGHNNEPHNHNDIGAFMITVGDETFISDLGCGEYVKETFNGKTRYNYIQNSSRGHSVPIVNGEYQHNGEQFCAKNVKAECNSFELNIEDAYTPGIIKEIKRRFNIEENKVILYDTFDFTSNTVSVVERFVSKIKPQLCEGYVDFNIARIVYDSKKYLPSVSTESFVAHDGVGVVKVYLIDFVPVSNDENVFRFEFCI